MGITTITHPGYVTNLKPGTNEIVQYKFKGTHTIWEHEYQCTIDEHEYNIYRFACNTNIICKKLR